jgi:predicted secreted protein
MAKILNVAPKDIHVEIEFPIKELELLKEGLELSTIGYDGEIGEELEAAKYIKAFYDFLNDFLTEVKKNGP